LISRIKINSVDDGAPRLTVVRAPKGPDAGSKGFHPDARAQRIAGKIHLILIDCILFK
jgi:SUZ-C motif